MEAQSRWSSIWRTCAIFGICLTAIGIGSAYFSFFEHLWQELLTLWTGLLLASVGLIGWASFLKRWAKIGAAGLVFILPWAGYLIIERNAFFDKPAPLDASIAQNWFVLPVASALALVLLIMACFRDDT